jgi:hypothetical protein
VETQLFPSKLTGGDRRHFLCAMLSPILWLFSCSIVHTYTPELEHLFHPKKQPTIFLFYSAISPADMSIFDRAASLVYGAEFVSVDCDKYFALCKKKMIEPLPGIRLASPSGSFLTLTNELSCYPIVEFVLSNSKARSIIELGHNLRTLGESNFSDFLLRPGYNLVTFMNSRDRMSTLLYPTVWQLADIFEKEGDMAFGIIDCYANVSFCFSVGVTAAPLLQIYNNGQVSRYSGIRELPYLLDFVNGECGKMRNRDGGLITLSSDSAIEKRLAEFLNADKSEQEIIAQKFEADPKLPEYARAIRRIMKEGVTSIGSDIAKCEKLLMTALDEEARARVQNQLTILRQFDKLVKGEEL